MIKAALLGLAVGDALGVPVEFRSRSELKLDPVTDMRDFGTHRQEPGTWSDDSSLTFCLAESLEKGIDLDHIARSFVRWLKEGHWAAHGKVFDIGGTTHTSITRYAMGCPPELAGGMDAYENGNGSLMRILPLVFCIKNKPIEERYQLTKLVSSITHGHIRSIIACFYYLEFARLLIERRDKFSIYEELKGSVSQFLESLDIPKNEIGLFDRLFKGNIHTYAADEIQSSGYVIHTLEASIWCLLTTESYADSVLKAVNLGEDTDTTAAVTGGLAGMIYGEDAIPERWLSQLARRSDIEQLAKRLSLSTAVA